MQQIFVRTDSNIGNNTVNARYERTIKEQKKVLQQLFNS